MLEMKTDSPGKITVSYDAIAVITGTAALEVEGVIGLHGNLVNDVTGKMGRKNLSKGVDVTLEDDNVSIKIDIIVQMGEKIHEVSREVQQKIKTAIETMIGLNVQEVSVTVSSAVDGKKGS